MDTLKLTKKQAWPIVEKVFPEYAGRKFKLVLSEKFTLYNMNWDGGSRNIYGAVKVDGTSALAEVSAPWNNPYDGLSVDLPVDAVVVCHSFFCGQDGGITIYASPKLAASLGKAVGANPLLH